jgi:hypothetical protein
MKYETVCERLIAAILFALCVSAIFFSGIDAAQAQGSPFYGYGYGYGYGDSYYRAAPPRVAAVPAPVAPAPVVPVPVVPVPVASSGNYVIEYRDVNNALFMVVQINTRLGFASISSTYTGLLDPYLFKTSGYVSYAYVKFVDGNGLIRGNLRGVNGGPVVDRTECMFSMHGFGGPTTIRVCPMLRPGDIVLIGHHRPDKLRIYDAVTGVQLPVSATLRYQISPTGELVLRLASPAFMDIKGCVIKQYQVNGVWTGDCVWVKGTEW